ncbi:MAG: redoxin domain-containing protein [Pyrinomonadaceae bacterium]
MTKNLILMIVLTVLQSAISFGQTSPPPQITNNSSPETKKSASFNPADLVGLKGQAAPQFVLPSMDRTEYNLENLRGKIVVVNLWGTFCAPCMVELPELNRLVEKYKNKNVVFLAPAPDGKTDLEVFLQKHPFNYQVLPNAFAVIKDYAPRRQSDDPQKKGGFMMLLPTHLVIDQNGFVTYHTWGYGKKTAKNLSAEIDRLLNKSK